jgi:2-polyprenyl-3-methyl-5-hydroxy-6-metoxy-1,4-benzoquinol methylase
MERGTDRQADLDAKFGAEARFWNELYSADDVLGAIHRYRNALAHRWIEELDEPAAASILEVGCGAGLLSVELARRGLDVEATDPVEAMLEQARQRAAGQEMPGRVRFSLADVHALGFADETFQLIVVLGVLPWIDRPEAALAEIARVLAPGGRLIVSINNRAPLHVLADPVRLPMLAPLRDSARRALAAVRPVSQPPPSRPIGFARPADLACQLDAVGLRLVRSQAFGFGPFTLLGRQVLADRIGVDLERRLQRRAERSNPILDAVAAQFLVLAQRAPD